ncbi:MAG: DPP IV N-terminal domain-containing protein [Anaerolineae bacterium]|uniref:DPP IV N-terminal domain-containing protein n=1 Tax=Candidatus Amarolinea dominans TaxID=3140696 RepID=UPI0031361F87|nr:PD40 domain-containing protein [Anaerolineae bacterium]
MDTNQTDSTTLQYDPLYQEALLHLQQGHWPEASQRFDVLMQRYEGVNELRSLQEYAQLKASLTQHGPRTGLGGTARLREIFTRRRALALLLLLVFGAWVVFFRSYVKPATDVRASALRLDEHLTVAHDALTRSDYVTAQREFQAVLTEDPNNTEALQGLNTARSQADLEATYARAAALQRDGNWEQSLPLLQQIAATSPGFRDVDEMLQRANRGQGVGERYAAADEAFRTQNWQAAIEGYEAVRSLDVRYEQTTVTANLFAAYVHQGKTILSSETSADAAETALSMFQQALTLKPRESEATTLRDQTQIFITGNSAFQKGEWRSAIALLRPVYDQAPGFLNGMVATRLYDAYLESGSAYQRERNYVDAFKDYTAASELQVPDASRAQERVRMVGLLLTPTPTPSPSPTPTEAPATPTPQPPQVAVEPIKLSSPKLKGMIVFRSMREEGAGLFAMRPDGKGIVPVEDEQGTVEVVGVNGENLTMNYRSTGYEKLEALDAWTPDRRLRVFVEGSKNEKTMTPIYLWHYDIPQNWDTVRTQVLDNTATNYNPVLTPDGTVIVFVSQKDGDDEIWRINSDGTGLRQLTRNDWEWDKHPSLSADGKWIVFWSNRGSTGNGQLLIMDLDGKNVRTISSGKNYDWDPIWIK